jgi:hypothetical protein
VIDAGYPYLARTAEQEHAHILRGLAEQVDEVAGGSLTDLGNQLRRGARRLESPMRVAVAGQLSRGKSTLVNALLGEALAATGDFETTWAVSEFRYASAPRLTVHYRDRSPERTLPFASLATLTNRGEQPPDQLRRIARIDCHIDNALLREHNFRLIDTPGLNSVYGADSASAEQALLPDDSAEKPDDGARKPDDSPEKPDDIAEKMAAESRREVEQAHAVLYLFKRDVSVQDAQILRRFVLAGGGPTTPLNSFGVLSHCDELWSPRNDGPAALTLDPIKDRALALIRQRLHQYPEIDALLHTIVPVAGLLAEGAQTMPADRFEWLADLVRPGLVETGPQQWIEWLRFRGRFGSGDLPLTAGQRRELIGRLGAWGLFRALHHARDKCDESELRQRLVEESGLIEVRRLIAQHFGQRARLTKLDQTLREAQRKVTLYRQRLAAGPDDMAAGPGREAVDGLLDDVADTLSEMRRLEHGFQELRILRACYDNRLDGANRLGFTDAEHEQLLAVTGEWGIGCGARLGLDGDARLSALAAAAAQRLDHWSRRCTQPGLNAAARPVAQDARDCYERIALRVSAARQLIG